MAFLSSNLSDVQSNLQNAIAEIEKNPNRKPIPMTYQNFASGIYQTHCRNWCHAPGDDALGQMHTTFFDKCTNVVLKDLVYLSSFIPNWVLNVVYEKFFSILPKYMDDITYDPLSLVQLCRKVLSTSGPSLLINLFRTIERQDVREHLFHTCHLE